MKARVLIVDDDEGLRRALADRFGFWGHDVTTAENGAAALELTAARAFDLILLDLAMPGLSGLEVLAQLPTTGSEAEVVVLTAHGSLEKAVEAIKAGADDFLAKPADFDLLQRIVERALEKRRLQRVNEALTEQAAGDSTMIVGPSVVMKDLLATATRAAQSDATVLLIGESGTGKQVIAERIHAESPLCDGPFIYVNCVAISDDLIESTLFGHEKGAFTGAVGRKPGRLEAAAGGTAFLDEVGDISANLQTKLLHFLESGEFERVGGTKTISVDCRIVAATNKDLQAEVKAGRFREDLYYRLNVIGLHLPPLRERPEDIPVLAMAFLERYAVELKRSSLTLAPGIMDLLTSYAWPGNVRQLKNAVERMAVLAGEEVLTADLLPPEILAPTADDATNELNLPYKEALTVFKGRIVQHALRRCDGNQTRAAEMLGLQRSYLNRLIRELDVATPDTRST